MTGVSHNFSQACSPKNTCNWSISLFLVQYLVLLEFVLVALIAVASQVASSHRINNMHSFADTGDDRCSRLSAY